MAKFAPRRLLCLLASYSSIIQIAFTFDESSREHMNCTLDSDMYKYTLNKVKSAKIIMKPYPHVFIKDIFKPNLYACILSKLPDGGANSQTSPYAKDYSQRYLVPLMGKNGEPLKPKDKDSTEAAQALDTSWWSAFAQMIATEAMATAWVRLFDVTTGQRYKKGDAAVKFLYRMDLSRDMSGYEIGPHTDTDKKWVTTLYYLPRTAAHSHIGTAILKSKSGKMQKSRMRHVPFGPDFQVAFKAPFVPNSVMAFAPCWHSWHMVPKVQEHIMRDTLQGFVGSTTTKATRKFQDGVMIRKVPCGGAT